MAHTSRARRSTTGRSGTPPTWSRASAARRPRKQPRTLRSVWKLPPDEGRHRSRRSLSGRRAVGPSRRALHALGVAGRVVVGRRYHAVPAGHIGHKRTFADFAERPLAVTRDRA